jgi:hypothetical protein
VNVRAAVLVVERHRPGLNDDHNDAGMVVPSRRSSGSDRDGGDGHVGRDAVAAADADAVMLGVQFLHRASGEHVGGDARRGVARAAPVSTTLATLSTAMKMRVRWEMARFSVVRSASGRGVFRGGFHAHGGQLFASR